MNYRENCQAVEIVRDQSGNSIVQINSIIFRGRQNIDWKAVELYLQKYIGEVVEVSDEKIWIEKAFVDEYTGSLYTRNLKGGIAKVKANAAQGILEMLKIAVMKKYMENKKEKHLTDAKFGWKYYRTRFAIPIYNEKSKEITYNKYSAILILQHSKDGKLYLYDMQEIKKETGNPLST